MPARIRLQRKGKKRAPYYHIVVADARAPRDGRYIERLGAYDPNVNPAMIEVDRDKALEWLQKGAQPSDTCRAILSYTGVLYKNHLLKGVKKGAFDEAEAERRFNTWLQEKEQKIEEKRLGLKQAAIDSKKERKAAEVKKAEEMAAAITAKLAASMPPPDDAAPVAEGEDAATNGEVTDAAAPEAAIGTPAEETGPAPEAPAEEVTAADDALAEADDLTKVEGIGPKIAEALTGAGIATYADLAKADVAKINEIITDIAGNHVPDTWPEQAEMASAGKWDELKKWQDELDGGKPAEAKPEEPASAKATDDKPAEEAPAEEADKG